MATVSDSTIASAAQAAGFRGYDLFMAVAVALAESGGDASATNRNVNGSIDYGLWQINSIHKAILASGQWSNPVDNAKMAYRVYSDAGKKFTPWVTFNRGSFLPFMQRAQTATGPLGPPGNPDTKGPNILGDNPLGGVADLGNMITDSQTWKSVGLFIAGGMLILWSLMQMTGDGQLSPITKTLFKTVAKVPLK